MATHVSDNSLTFLRSKRGAALLFIWFVVALFFFRPGVGKLRDRIAASISRAIGRRVEIASVTVRLLPRPGFDLENFVVYDDPDFGAEPMLRSADVTAALRVTSLLRGHLEIARLSLTEPSLNFVRTQQGRWNLETLLERANRNPIAPTGKRAIERRPGFPYIEASRGRINFKLGPEKTPYTLTAADFSLWQDSENSWGMRLRATPWRSDQNLSDTGLISVDGEWQRASSLHDTPLEIRLHWERAQLGQVTTLIGGRDMGWRGDLLANMVLIGTPSELKVNSDVTIHDFRRYDVMSGGALRLRAHCDCTYKPSDRTVSNLDCQAPVGQGAVSLGGNISGMPGSPGYDLILALQDVPLQSLVGLAGHMWKRVPSDLAADGSLRAQLKIGRQDKPGAIAPVWRGAGETKDLVLRSTLEKTELAIGRIPFVIGETSLNLATPHDAAHTASEFRSSENLIDIGPFTVSVGRPSPVTVHASGSWSRYEVSLVGEGSVQRMLQVAHLTGLPIRQAAADGVAKIDLRIAGSWSPSPPAEIVGNVELRAVRAEVRGLDQPVTINSARLSLLPDGWNVHELSAQAAGSTWTGSVKIPRRCPPAEACPVRFDLHADQVAIGELNQLLNPRLRKQPWYQFLAQRTEPSFLSLIEARGRVQADRIQVRKLIATNASANVELQGAVLQITDLNADLLGGRYRGDWEANFTPKLPLYRSSGRFDHVVLRQLADLMQDEWVTGAASSTYRAQFSGLDASELFSSAEADIQVIAHDATLPRITLSGQTGALHAVHFDGHLVLHSGSFHFQESTLVVGDSTYQVGGTASLDSTLGLKLVQAGTPVFNITGTVDRPHVIPALTPASQARLRP